MEEADKQIVNFDKTPAFSQGVRCAGLLSHARGCTRGAAPSALPVFLFLPRVGGHPGASWGALPPQPPRAGAPPRAPGAFAGRQSLHPPAGAPPCTRVTFSPMRKSPKNLPEGDTPSGYSPWGALSSPQRLRRSPQKAAPPCAAKMPPKMPQSLYPHNQYR